MSVQVVSLTGQSMPIFRSLVFYNWSFSSCGAGGGLEHDGPSRHLLRTVGNKGDLKVYRGHHSFFETIFFDLHSSPGQLPKLM